MGTTLLWIKMETNKKLIKLKLLDSEVKVLSLRNPHLLRKDLNNPPIKPQIIKK
jgi:hypothetical protein